jgi:carbon storage regulator
MLVLSRRPGESIVIDGNIRIKLVMCRGNHVRIGIDAPNRIPVIRQELLVSAPGSAGCASKATHLTGKADSPPLAGGPDLPEPDSTTSPWIAPIQGPTTYGLHPLRTDRAADRPRE